MPSRRVALPPLHQLLVLYALAAPDLARVQLCRYRAQQLVDCLGDVIGVGSQQDVLQAAIADIARQRALLTGP